MKDYKRNMLAWAVLGQVSDKEDGILGVFHYEIYRYKKMALKSIKDNYAGDKTLKIIQVRIIET